MPAAPEKVQALKDKREKFLAEIEADHLTIGQTLDVLGIGRTTYYKLVEEGRLAPKMWRRCVRVPCAQVADYLDEEQARLVDHEPSPTAAPRNRNGAKSSAA